MSRHTGRITDWNDDRGFGFVVDDGGGPRTFVHIKAFESFSRRPVNGDRISYAVVEDAKGRPNASSIRMAGDQAVKRSHRRVFPRRTIAITFLGIVTAGAWYGPIPKPVSLAYLVLSLVSFFFYWADKSAAARGGQRTPEATLHLADLLGGWPGALMAQHAFRHKTVKVSFQWMFWLTVILNVGIVGWWVTSGTAQAYLGALG